jgi:sugar/nucleoside kinase (ribokinase family)
MNRTLSISGTGCCLVDRIYPDVDFNDPVIRPYMSRKGGDGGLHPGRLVFSEQFESFAGEEPEKVVGLITRGLTQPTMNVGGPSVVSLIHAAQLLQDRGAEIRFHGVRGDDDTGRYLLQKLDQTPVNLDHFRTGAGPTPSTIVLSDPSYQDGHGERMFINTIGAAHHFGPPQLDDSFFHADIVVFGGTALVPGLHDHLTELLHQARSKGAFTIVNTVYDFRSEMERPGQRWQLGRSDESYRYIDLLIMDREEALHLSGTAGLPEAAEFFIRQGVFAFIITNGTRETLAWSEGNHFGSHPLRGYPVSSALIGDLKNGNRGDTTGCGDNFAGGVLASLAWQMLEGKDLQLSECVAWGTVSGGYCCFHMGGTFIEMEPGEKLELLRPYYESYGDQIHG